MNNKGFTLIELMIVVVIIGILAMIAIPNFMNMSGRAKEASVKSNCHTVQLAVEDFTVQNDGRCPMDIDTDTTPSGDTVIDLLPGGVRIENPFTRVSTEPVNHEASSAGQTGYVVFVLNGVPSSYTITGAGRNGSVISTLTSGQ